MKSAAFFAYADNYLIDVKFGIIMDVEASRAIRQAEVGALRTMIERTAACFGIKPEWLVGDTAYGSAPNLDWLVNEQKIAPYIPVIDKSKREDGTFSRDDFSFDKERDIYICPAGPMGQFGHKLIDAIAAIILVTDVGGAFSLWQPIFDIGPKGHYAIGHFFLCFFSNLNEGTVPAAFVARWRPMIEAVMAGRGWEGGPWYHQQSLERQALGFSQPDALVRPVAEARSSGTMANAVPGPQGLGASALGTFDLPHPLTDYILLAVYDLCSRHDAFEKVDATTNSHPRAR